MQQAARSMKKRVLIVDDNEMMQNFLRHILGPHLSIDTADSGEEALQLLRNAGSMPDLILADDQLDDYKGPEFIRKIKMNFPGSDVPVVMLSASRRARMECLEAGAAEFVVKPFAPGEMKNRLFGLLKPEGLQKIA